jgi:hypothetical protein
MLLRAKQYFQKTLVLAFLHGRIQAEHMGVHGVYSKLGKEIQRENSGT